MNPHIQQCTGVILAGGENRRMPVRKAFIEVRGQKIIDRNLRMLKDLFQELFIVTNEPELYTYTSTELYGDMYTIRGPMTGILTALFHSRTRWIFVSACDMPFISGQLIRYMASKRRGYDAVVPYPQGRAEPLFAFYAKGLLTRMEKSLLVQKQGVKDFLHNQKKRVQYIPLREIAGQGLGADSFINLNAPEDIELYLEQNDIDKFKKASERRRSCSVSVQQN